MKIKFYTQRYGSGVAIGMSGDKREVQRESNILYNFKVTNSDPIWMSETFAYILTTEELLLQGMTAKALVSLIDTKFGKRTIYKGKRVSMIPKLAKEKALRQIKNFLPETFLNELEIRHAQD